LGKPSQTLEVEPFNLRFAGATDPRAADQPARADGEARPAVL